MVTDTNPALSTCAAAEVEALRTRWAGATLPAVCASHVDALDLLVSLGPAMATALALGWRLALAHLAWMVMLNLSGWAMCQLLQLLS